jgi:hypothetical protein
MSEDVECSEAYKNPSCPYVTQININTACMKQVDKALIVLRPTKTPLAPTSLK